MVRLGLTAPLAYLVSGGASIAQRQAESPATVVAAALVNPRGMAFDAAGRLYVAIAGIPGEHAGVAVIAEGCPRTIVSGLPAYRIVFGGITGVSDVAFHNGQLYLLLSGGNTDGGGMANGLYRVENDGRVSLVADVSAFIRDQPVAEKPRDFDTDGQPYALLPMGEAFWATEGNSNQVLRLGRDGTVSRIADLSVGHPIPTGIQASRRPRTAAPTSRSSPTRPTRTALPACCTLRPTGR
jgi:hypothetical protein